MKNLLLLGDSIRVGYCNMVKEKLAGKVNVYFPPENCRFAQYTLRELERWTAELPPIDVIHWNNGLWDSAHLSISGFYNLTKVGIILEIPNLYPEYCLFLLFCCSPAFIVCANYWCW